MTITKDNISNIEYRLCNELFYQLVESNKNFGEYLGKAIGEDYVYITDAYFMIRLIKPAWNLLNQNEEIEIKDYTHLGMKSEKDKFINQCKKLFNEAKDNNNNTVYISNLLFDDGSHKLRVYQNNENVGLIDNRYYFLSNFRNCDVYIKSKKDKEKSPLIYYFDEELKALLMPIETRSDEIHNSNLLFDLKKEIRKILGNEPIKKLSNQFKKGE